MKRTIILIVAAAVVFSLVTSERRAAASKDSNAPVPVSKPQNVAASVQSPTESKQSTPNRSARDRNEAAILTPDGFIIKDGAAYYSVAGVLLPVPGGGASGCFGDAPTKEVVFRKPVVIPSMPVIVVPLAR